MDTHKAPAVLATELCEQLTNGNKRLVRTTLMALPRATALMTVFYMRSNYQGTRFGSQGVGALRRLLTTLLEEQDGAHNPTPSQSAQPNPGCTT